ncbi:hypothetical protein CCS79_12450 [Clostridium diolis]|uniref:polysaccharide deacetylase family protein n=1 Tax=Clostridium diolis TaxID=223919 RepID=UPI000B3FC72A|nr:polysaccharide deacetylase family protein [Clostridium diolis]OVE67760.1 hypothetical protein CCS79_12450 [Clostridium diolis]
MYILFFFLIFIFSGCSQGKNQPLKQVKQNETTKDSRMNTTPSVYMTIIDDDAKIDVWKKMKPIAEDEGIPITLAVPVQYNNGVEMMTKDQLLALQNMGWEMAGHSYHHVDLTKCTDEELYTEIVDSKNTLASWGLKIKNIVYPYGSGTEERCKTLSSKYYNCGVRVGGGYNVRPINKFMLNRVALGSYFDAHDITGQGLATSTFEYYKACLDQTIKYNGWIIFMTHSAEPGYDKIQQQYTKDLIDYAKSKNVAIVNLQDGYEAFNK